jgi:hypothetical protein
MACRCQFREVEQVYWNSRLTDKDMVTRLLDFSFKNYKCAIHNKFFEVNVYQKDPVNAHHWRANIARPATEIDL